MDEKTDFESIHSAIVVKRHQTVKSMSKLSLTELRFLNFCIAQCDTRKESNRQVKTNLSALKTIYPSMDQRTCYGIIKQTWTSMNAKPLEVIEDGDNGLELVGYAWIEEVRYNPKTQDFSFKITAGAVPHLLGIKEKFSEYRLRDVSHFTSRTTWMLFEYLETLWEHQNSWRVELDELKAKLGIPGRYPRWADFQRVIITPAINEINANTELSVTCEKEKRGRSIFALVFFVEQKAPEGVIDVESDRSRSEALTQILLRANISKKQAQNFVQDAEKFLKIKEMTQLSNALIKSYDKLKKKPCTLPKYVMGGVRNALHQRQLFTEKEPEPDHKEALTCWMRKRQDGKKCPVRERGEAGQRKKCQVCLIKLPVADWGI
jgi:plasmid replication initiation protein